MKSAKQSDWQTEELPSSRSTVSLRRVFSPDEMPRIRAGLVPKAMEDKWFIYWENDTLYFHRSWTGICVYIVRFAAERDGYRMVEADLNRDPEQYNETSDNRDAKMISYLIDALLLQQPAVFPSEDDNSETNIILQWSQVGRAMLGQHPTPNGDPEQSHARADWQGPID